ncbi:hypothetical protein GCM10027594_01990 [Hymenobacter agri]
MKLSFTQESDFRRERDFGAKVSATFDFLSSQFKPFVKCLAYFTLPGALLMGIGLALFMGKAAGFYSSIFSAARRGGGAMRGVDPLAMYRGWGGVGMGLTVLGGLVTLVLLSATVYSYLRVRLHLSAAETVQPRQVWAWLRPRLGRMLLACLLLMALWIGALMVWIGALMVLGGITAVGGIKWMFLLIFVLYAAIFWLAGCLALYFPVLWLEDLGPTQALSRCFYLIKGKWWSTFGLLMIMAIIQSTMSYLFAIPMYGLLMMDMLQLTKTGASNGSSLLMQAATLLYAGSAVLLLALPLLAMVLPSLLRLSYQAKAAAGVAG